ncbi:MAG: bifunctional riboflavin kinase/FAD synthetase [Candidatus Zixiibacteriota bacterium]|nr:MAG: bifunctional riboflavin kinase/FAD synthetase [candidate division Zixibacteria bacterium]
MSVEFFKGLDAFPPVGERKAVVTVGTFDGIHRGHQEIFRRVKAVRDQGDYDAVMVTFHPHPRVIVTPDQIPMLLTSIEEKEQFVPDFFEGKVLVLDFDKKLRDMSAEQFVEEILVGRIGARKLIVGYDHGFGRGREGSIPSLQLLGRRLGFDVEVVDPVFCGGKPVSSSRIRRAMSGGRYQEAIELLGHDYAIYGTVERGIGLGRKIGYPTANLKYNPRKLLPPQGVYACWARVRGQDRDGMMFIGRNHFNPVHTITVEANLFDFNDDIYNEELIVYPKEFVRNNHKFDSTETLIEQIGKDKKYIMSLIRKGEKQWQ